MNIAPRQLRIFLYLASSLSFRATAEHFGVTQPTMSKIVKDLERELGVTLFDRTTRRVKLSFEGEELLGIAARLIDDFDHGLIELAQTARRRTQTLSVAALPTLASKLLPGAISRLRAERPDMIVQVHDVYAEAAIDMLRTRTVDLVFSSIDALHDDLSYSSAVKERFVLLVSREHFGAVNTRNWSGSAIDGIPLIGMRRGTSTRSLVEDAFLAKGMRFRPALELLNISSIGSFVISGFGAAILPISAAEIVQDDRIRVLPMPDVPRRSLGIITRRGSRLSETARRFIEEIHQALVEHAMK